MHEGTPTERALTFAAHAHRGQTRKGSGLPYVVHTVDVAKKLGDAGIKDQDVIIAGLLHDVVEDTEVDLQTVASEFGERAAGFVDEMTFDESKESKSDYIASFARGSVEALAVKLMDRSANVTDYEKERPEYAPKYAGMAAALYAAVFAREDELRSTFGDRTTDVMLIEARRLNELSQT